MLMLLISAQLRETVGGRVYVVCGGVVMGLASSSEHSDVPQARANKTKCRKEKNRESWLSSSGLPGNKKVE